MKTIDISCVSSVSHSGMCFVCKSFEDHRINIHYEHTIDGITGICTSMFSQCYDIQIQDDSREGEICFNCLCQLRNALTFRNLVEAVEQQLCIFNKAYLLKKQDESVKQELCIGDEIKSSIIHGDDLNPNTFPEPIDIADVGVHNVQLLELEKDISCNAGTDVSDVVFVFARSDNETQEVDEKKTNNWDPPSLEEGITICPLCNSEEVTHETLKKHYKTHFPKFMCDVCGRGMNSKGHYRLHLKMHKNVRYPCKLCDKVYKARSVLREHVMKHHENIHIQKYKCHKCPQKFVNYRTRKKHMFDKHGVACKKFACDLCNKSFFTQAGHKLHYKKIHLKIKDHMCKECSCGFGTQVELNLHMKSHSDVRNFSCDICGRRFKDKKTLIRHMVVHSKIKQFTCSYCDASFTHRYNALRHERKQHPSFDLQSENILQ